MSVLQRWGPWNPRTRRPAAMLGSLLLALTLSPRAHAVTAVSIDGHPSPVSLVEGETVMIHCDVANPGGGVITNFARDLTGSLQFDATAPIFFATAPGSLPIADGGSGDTDPTPGKVAFPIHVESGWPAGPYVLHIQDLSDHISLDLPLGVAPRPQSQAIAGRVAVLDSTPAGSLPPDAIIWAYRGLQTPVASAHLQADGSYRLPVPPGTYIVFAEWFGSLRSQRQVVTVTAGQAQSGVDLPLLVGQEVSGTVRAGTQRMADALVQAVSASGIMLSTRTFVDGSYTLVLPSSQYRISAPGGAETVTVADGAVDGVDFPMAPTPPAPAPGTIVTVAGNGIPGFGGDGRLAITARLPLLVGIALDKAGNLYMADNSNRIRKVAVATGIITTVAGSGPYDAIRGLVPPFGGDFGGDGGPATQASLSQPQHVAVDAAGNLLISDKANRRIRRVDAMTGLITTVAGNGQPGSAGDGGPATAAQIGTPRGVAADGAGNLYVADNRNQLVRKVDGNGIITTIAGGGSDAVTDGAAATDVALNQPWELAVDQAGNLFIADAGLNQILKVSPAGTLRIVAGTGTAGFSGDGGKAPAAQFNAGFPALAVDSAGNLFFADQGNNRIRKISPDGMISTVVGSGPAFPDPGSFAGDGGPATAARLRGAWGLAIDAAGNLLFSDTGDGRIRKVIGIAAPGLVAGG
jgi:NHL repeat-containing protein